MKRTALSGVLWGLVACDSTHDTNEISSQVARSHQIVGAYETLQITGTADILLDASVAVDTFLIRCDEPVAVQADRDVLFVAADVADCEVAFSDPGVDVLFEASSIGEDTTISVAASGRDARIRSITADHVYIDAGAIEQLSIAELIADTVELEADGQSRVIIDDAQIGALQTDMAGQSQLVLLSLSGELWSHSGTGGASATAAEGALAQLSAAVRGQAVLDLGAMLVTDAQISARGSAVVAATVTGEADVDSSGNAQVQLD